MIKKKCLICKSVFYTKPCLKNKSKYCSYQCYWKSLKGKVSWNKGIKTGLVPKSAFKKGMIPWNKGLKWLAMKGQNHPNWRGGRKINSQGYILIYKPNHPFCDNTGYIREHRFIIEQYLGRYLKSQERPHHLNNDKQDNRLENLYLFNSETKHQKYHWVIKKNKIRPIIQSNLFEKK